jgi:hypothetical protein
VGIDPRVLNYMEFNSPGVTRRIKFHVVQNPGVNPHPVPAQNFLTVEIPTPKPYIFMIGVNIVTAYMPHILYVDFV